MVSVRARRFRALEEAGKKHGRRTREFVARAADAASRRRRVAMRYASASSGRTRGYVVDPQRISYADGGVYLTAFVPEYGELRTFAAERIEERTDGSIVLTLDVCRDRPLRRWILGVGALARVECPAALAQEILDEIEGARGRYVPRLTFAMAKMPADAVRQQPPLPWRRIS